MVGLPHERSILDVEWSVFLMNGGTPAAQVAEAINAVFGDKTLADFSWSARARVTILEI